MTLIAISEGQPVTPLELVPFEDRTHPDGRPWLFTNMVSSIDGAAAVDGLSGPMGDDDDREMFRALRASADAIIVGAGTVNAERYKVPQRSAEVDTARASAGRAERPLLTIITASLSVDPDLELFSDGSYRPLILTSGRADAATRAALEPRADIVELGAERVDLGAALEYLGAAGHRAVLSEGGPTLNGQLVADGLIDEWNLTLAPLLVGGTAPRTAHGRNSTQASELVEYRVARVWQGERALFGRWVRN